MEKVIYDNGMSKLVTNFDGETVELSQYLDGEVVGYISMYVHEFSDLNKFINKALVKVI